MHAPTRSKHDLEALDEVSRYHRAVVGALGHHTLSLRLAVDSRILRLEVEIMSIKNYSSLPPKQPMHLS